MILTVYLNDAQQMLTEVPVTPATRVIDVVEYCKEAGEGECHLAEVWNGHGESIQTNHPPAFRLHYITNYILKAFKGTAQTKTKKYISSPL